MRAACSTWTPTGVTVKSRLGCPPTSMSTFYTLTPYGVGSLQVSRLVSTRYSLRKIAQVVQR
jgi:hypothetical protein